MCTRQVMSTNLTFIAWIESIYWCLQRWSFRFWKLEHTRDSNPSCKDWFFDCKSDRNRKIPTSDYWSATVSWIFHPFQLFIVSKPYIYAHRRLKCFRLVFSDSYSNYARLFRKWPEQSLHLCHNAKRNNRMKKKVSQQVSFFLLMFTMFVDCFWRCSKCLTKCRTFVATLSIWSKFI